ncbi:MAG: amidohydrolase family protein [Thermomicrobiales bacterium]
MAKQLELDHIAAIDQHCHPWRRMDAPFEALAYRTLFSEGGELGAGKDADTTIYYRWTMRELGRLLGCKPVESDVLAARAGLGHDAYAAKLMAEANIGGAVIDHLYAGRGSNNYTVAEMGERLGGAATVSALRLESVLEQFILDSVDAGEVESRFRARLDRRGLGTENVVSLKSIVAYRTGLNIQPVDRATAYAAFEGLKATANATGGVRVAEKPFLDYFLRIALEWCAAERFPIQFHTGFGDPDVNLITANPLMLRDILQDDALREAPINLLHAGYPYVRELSYLASVYPNVTMDIGLAIPFAAGELDGVVRQALAVAPTTKIVWSSDGFILPEHTWFAAVQGRRAIGRVLDELISHGALDREGAEEVAGQILAGNSRRIYGLPETP